MKKRMSIKLRLTLWFTLFMMLIAALCLGLMIVIGSRVAENEASERLGRTVRSDLEGISYTEGRLSFDAGFSFYKDGVYTIIYNVGKAMLGGETPPGFPVTEELKNGVTRTVSGEGETFLIFDLFMPSGWEDGVWVRGVTEYPDVRDSMGQSVTVFLIILPFLIFMAALGGYLTARHSLKPIERITELAGSISEGRDLKKRIAPEYESTDEAGRLAAAFDQMISRLEGSFEAEKQFASDASHELRTPTAVIVAQCSYLDKYADSTEDYKEGVEVIKRQADRMSVMIDRLLDITRLDFGTKKLEKTDTDLSELLQTLCEEQDNGARGISLSTDIAQGIHADIDPYLFSRVINNLLENARRYGKENGNIRASLKKEGDRILLSVEDDGIGIASEEQEKIWRRFYQVDPSRERGSGLGLGLSMVKQIVELHGGSIKVESEPGKGSRFTVELQG